jgi:hypothetical protein
MIWGRKSKLKRRGWGIESKVIEENNHWVRHF